MGSLFGALLHSASTMRVFERGLQVVQNNVTNASTPGYSKQRLGLLAKDFQPDIGLPGGVAAGDLESFRSRYAESAVRSQQEFLGFFEQKASDLSRLEAIFEIGEHSGVSGAMSNLFQSFSILAVAPNDNASRQVVLDRAAEAASSFNALAGGIARGSASAQQQTSDVVTRINHLVGQLRELNVTRRRNFESRTDAGMDARIHTTLEELSELINFTSLEQEDGSFTILLGGESPLLMGDRQLELTADFSSSEARILDSQGKDLTAMVRSGRLGALLEMRNELLPSFLADVDRLATAFADRVNQVLRGGVDAAGLPPTVDLFSYDATAGAGLTLAVNPLAPADLAAADPAAPGGNATALALAALANSKEIDGYTFAQFYGNVAAGLGRELSGARQDQHTQEQLLTQARSLRGEISGVSLDEEAAHMIEFQRAYQATARLLTVLNELTETVINLAR
jgi:flagellar hook-associated protein 1 FlgK